MTDRERDHLLDRIEDLERANFRWKIATIVTSSVLGLLLVLGGISALAFSLRARAANRAAEEQMREAESARREEEAQRRKALQHFEEAKGQVDKPVREAEKDKREP
jgi:hypothetical protein